MKDTLFGWAVLLAAVSLSSLLMMVLARMGEPTAVWLACDTLGLVVCHGH